MTEEKFDGSILQTEIRNAKPNSNILKMSINAFENNQESKFWQEAFEMATIKLKKHGISKQ